MEPQLIVTKNNSKEAKASSKLAHDIAKLMEEEDDANIVMSALVLLISEVIAMKSQWDLMDATTITNQIRTAIIEIIIEKIDNRGFTL